MTQWNFYFSGVLCGKFLEDDTSLMVERLDEKTVQWLPKAPLTEENDAFFKVLCNRSMLSFFQHRKEYESKMSSAPEVFVTENGQRFQARRGEAYFQRDIKFPMDLFHQGGVIFAVVMSGRDYTAVLVKKGMERQTPVALWEQVFPGTIADGDEYQPGPCFPIRMLGTFQVPTRDGEKLATDVYLPVDPIRTRFPSVLVRTPYGKGKGAEGYFRFLHRGYAVIIQDVRGREDSTGEWEPQYHEIEDGDDTLNWMAAQEWSDGQAAMTGGSYLGYVQWAAAASGNPHLKAMLSSVCAGSAFVDIPRRGGCFNSGMLAWAFAMTEQRMRPDLMVRDDWDEVLNIRPLKDIPVKALGHEVPFLSHWLKHRDLDEFWKMSNWQKRYQGGAVPALIMSGWFDDNGMGTTEALELVKNWPKGSWKAILGPWMHSGNANYDLHKVWLGEDALRYDMDIQCMLWLEHFLKGVDNGIEKTPAVEYYTLGDNRWKTADSWPVESSKVCTYYLQSGSASAAGTGDCCGAGLLSAQAPGDSGVEGYVYDPENPATHIVDMSENELEVPEDYTKEEGRADILSFTTPVLTAPLTVTGELRATLYVSCDCPDTDFVVRLTDVDENGWSVKLADGVISAKYRNSFELPEYMEPGQVYKIPVRTTKISNTFLPGHRMRLTITSSAKNFIFPNSNTELGFDSQERRKANITLHWGGMNASCVEIPVEE